jgi:hypothetical protein
MERRAKRRAVGSLSAMFIGAILVAVTGYGHERLQSKRLDREITIDGASEDWDGALTNLGDRPISVGLLNDDEDLYLCLITDDRDLIRQVMMGGLTIGFEPSGEGEDAFWIVYPVGRGAPAGKMPRPEQRGERPEPGMTRPDSSFREATREVEFRGPGGRAARRVKVTGSGRVSLCSSGTEDAFVYELRVPLFGDDLHPEAVGAGPGGSVTIALETPEMERPERGEGMPGPGGRGGPPGGGGPRGEPDDGFGGGGFGGGPGGGRGGMRGGAPPSMTERLKAEDMVALAALPAK